MNTEKTLKQQPFYYVYVVAIIITSVLFAILSSIAPAQAINPAVTGISPNVGSSAGGQTVTITGTNLGERNVKLVQVSGGSDHTLAVGDDGRVYSWGANSRGQLGTGTTTASYAPSAVDASGVLAGKDISQVAAGGRHSLALDTDGHVYSWGNNDSSQLGNGATGGNSTTPVDISTSGALAGKTITALAAGTEHSLALDTDGALYSWGNNNSGRLGDGTTVAKNAPVAVDASGVLAGKTITQIFAGNESSYALASDGTLFGWGSNYFGQLLRSGRGTSTSPVELTAAAGWSGGTVTKFAAGNYHGLAITDDGTFVAWGANANGQLGNGTTTSSTTGISVATPVDVSGVLTGKTIDQLSAGNGVSYALSIDGEPFSWGSDSLGKLGNGTAAGDTTTPGMIDTSGALAGKTISSLKSSIYSHALVIDSDGIGYGWGQGEGGRIGYGGTANQQSPIAISRTGNSALTPSSTQVFFDNIPATDITRIDENTITVVTPAHAVGAVDVRIELGDDDPEYQFTAVNGYTYADPSSAPASVSASTTTDGVELHWSAPTDVGATPVTGYLVEYLPDNGATWITYQQTGADATSITIPREIMPDGAQYRFRVSAITVAGTSAPAEVGLVIQYPPSDNNDSETGESSDGSPSAPNTGFLKSTGGIASIGSLIALLLATAGAVIFRKTRQRKQAVALRARRS